MQLEEAIRQFRTEFGEMSVRHWYGPEYVAGLFSFQGIFRLSIWRQINTEQDKVIPWEDLQTIKSLCGYGEVDAVEVYPRDTDIVNTGNARHLYLFDHLLPFAMRRKPPVLRDSNSSELGETDETS